MTSSSHNRLESGNGPSPDGVAVHHVRASDPGEGRGEQTDEVGITGSEDASDLANDEPDNHEHDISIPHLEDQNFERQLRDGTFPRIRRLDYKLCATLSCVICYPMQESWPYENVRRQAENGCQISMAVQDSMNHFIPKDELHRSYFRFDELHRSYFRFDELRRSYFRFDVWAEGKFRLIWHGSAAIPANKLVPVEGGLDFRLHVGRLSGKPDVLSHDPSSPSEPSDMARSPMTVSKYTGWLRACVDDHPSCGMGTLSTLPTRVLSIGHRDENDIRLLETDGQQDRYMCLSYCLGGAEPMTTKASLPTFKDGITWQRLPLTFRHAIEVAWNLDVRYLWVDTLCIVQDDQEDWARESARMSSVYENGFLTIAATSCASPQDGLFSSFAPHEFTFRDFKGSPSTIYSWRTIDHFEDWHPKKGSALPLLRRGWAYQERLLSPRTLHFTESEVIWECKEKSRCECRWFEQYEKNCAGPVVYPKVRHSRIMTTDSTAEQLSARWREMVREYAVLGMTKETDRLTALSGVVVQMQAFRKSDYFFGLWRDTLLTDMLWQLELTPSSKRPYSRFYPSWSWAALSGTKDSLVEFPDDCIDFTPVAKVLRVPSPFYGGNVIEQGMDASIELTGPLLPAFIISESPWGFQQSLIHIRAAGKPWQFRMDYRFWLAKSGLPLWALHIGDGSFWGYYLVLTEAIAPGKGRFERVGVAKFLKTEGRAARDLVDEEAYVQSVVVV